MGKFKDEFAGLATAAVTLFAAYVTGGAAAFVGKAAFATWFGAAVTAYGTANARRAARRQRNAYNSSREDRTLTTTYAVAPRRFVVGRDRVGGNLSFIQTSGENSEYLHLVLTLCDACASIDDILFDDESIGGLDEYGFVQPGSKYWKTDEGHKVVKTTHPGRGGLIDLSSPRLKRVESFMIQQTEHGEADQPNDLYLVRDVDYIISPNGSGIGLAMLNDKGKGGNAIITYVYEQGEPLVRVYRWDGRGDAEAMRHPELEREFPDLWTSQHLQMGCAKLEIRIKYNQDIFTGGLPNISAYVTGVYIYDHRRKKFYPGYQNAAAVIKYFLEHEYGYRAKPTEFDLDNIAAELSHCESRVVVPGSTDQGRYTINGTIYADDSPDSTLRSLLTANLGSVVHTGGVYLLRSAQYRSPELTLNQEDLVEGPVTIGASQDRASVVNQVRGTFNDHLKKYQTNTYRPYRSQVYVDEDKGNEFPQTLDLPFCVIDTQCQRLAKLHLLKSRQATTLSASFSLKALRLQATDTVRVNLDYAGFENKVFRVVSKEFDFETMSVPLLLQEDAPEIYDENFNELLNPDPAPNTTLPDPRFVPPLSAFQVGSDAESYSVLPDGTISGHAICTWARVTASSILIGGHIEIWWKDGLDLSYKREKVDPESTEYLLKPVTPGQQINVYAIAVNGAGVNSAQVDSTIMIDTRIPSNKVGSTLTGNLLTNASFSRDSAGWRILRAAGVDQDNLVRIANTGDTELSKALPATMQIFQRYVSDGPSYAIQITKLRLEPGARYCQQFGGASRDVRLWSQVDFYGLNKVKVGSAQRSSYLEPVADDPVDGTTKRRAFGFFTVPEGAIETVFSIAKSGQLAAGGSASTMAYISTPMVSLAEPTQKRPPAWQEGQALVPSKKVIQLPVRAITAGIQPDLLLTDYVYALEGQRMTVTVSASLELVRQTGDPAEASFSLDFRWGQLSSLRQATIAAGSDHANGARFNLSGSKTFELDALFTSSFRLDVRSFTPGCSSARLLAGFIQFEIL